MLAAVDWQGIATVIAALGAAFATVIGALNRRALRIPSGGTIGQKVEYSHDTAIANNLLLRVSNGETRKPEPDELKQAGAEPPEVPS